MDYKNLIEILNNSIQIIGIFVAIIVGLVVSKILAIKEEQEQLKVKIENENKELNIMKERLSKVMEENYSYYKKDTIDEILYCIFSKKEKYDYLSDNTPHIDDEYKKEFYNYIIDVIRNAHEEFGKKEITLNEYKLNHKIKSNSIEEYAINELYDWGNY